MKKIFLDCGANNGMSIDMFRRKIDINNEFIIHSFECNPKFKNTLNSYSNDNTFIHDTAVWINNDTSAFYLGDDTSSSLNITKTTGRLDKYNPIFVQSLRLSEFIMTTFNIDDYIILKLDIEGAEYDVLMDLIETGAIKYINVLYGEFHNNRVDPKYTLMYEVITSYLYKNNLPMKHWCAETNTIE